MKILHTLPALNRGGTERFVLTLANYQQNLGHEVVVATFDRTNLWPNESSQLCIKTFHCSRAIHRFLRSPDHDGHEFSLFLNDFKPDVIHSHSYWTSLIVNACPRQPATYVQHFHLEYPEWKSSDRFLQRKNLGRWQLAWTCFLRRTRFIAVSDTNEKYYRKNLPAPLLPRLSRLPNFLGLPSRSVPRISCRAPLRIISVGRLVTVKRHSCLLALARILISRSLSFSMEIIGEGPLATDLEIDIEKAGLQDNMRLAGVRTDMIQCYEDADILLHPAIEETFGLVILEAMSRGLPCIVEEDCFGPKEFLNPGKDSLTASFSNPEGVADTIQSLLASDYLYQTISANAISTSKKFSLEDYWNKLAPIYGEESSSY